ncbi:cytochrome P450-like protein 2 [Elsinoe australis]|uniref:Cytochrome P450-like protein 2 n=1 Tax=Elsinoe australis TaxID=40998 RepID=A0A4U7BAF5_9PEZI|nr:cytochrome P450-like protein 2 [Elsinoe australis]
MDAARELFLQPDQHLTVSSVLHDRLTLIAIGVAVLLITTRVLSGTLGKSKKTPDGDTVPQAPYWIPIVGNAASFLFFSKSFFQWAREKYRGGAFAINMGGTTHNIIFKPALGHMLMNQKNEVADGNSVSKYLMGAIFSWPKREKDVYDRVMPDILDCYKQLLSNPGLSKLVDQTITDLKQNINNFVTFCESPVDQMYWERVSNVKPVTLPSGEQAEEVSLMLLIKDFIAQTANPALLGSDFVQNNPSFYTDLWIMDKAFLYLATGLPRWVPIPTLTRGVIAREKMMRALRTYETALDKWAAGENPGAEWSSLDDVSEIIKVRTAVYRKHNLSIESRASSEFGLAWAMNANANPLIFWIISRVYADPTLLEQIREEVAPYIQVRLPKQEFAVQELPILENVDHEGLANHCPLLKAAYVESLRLDTGVWSFKIMREDVTLTSREKDAQKYLIKKGTFCHVAHELHHRNGEYYDEPDVWRVGRHLKYVPGKDGEPAVAKADIGTVRSYGGGHSMCKGRAFALKEILIFTATIFTFYDMDPAKGEWKVPRAAKGIGTNPIKGDMRVRIKRRRMPSA